MAPFAGVLIQQSQQRGADFVSGHLAGGAPRKCAAVPRGRGSHPPSGSRGCSSHPRAARNRAAWRMLSITVNMTLPGADSCGETPVDHWKSIGDYAAGLGVLDECVAADAESRRCRGCGSPAPMDPRTGRIMGAAWLLRPTRCTTCRGEGNGQRQIRHRREWRPD